MAFSDFRYIIIVYLSDLARTIAWMTVLVADMEPYSILAFLSNFDLVP